MIRMNSNLIVVCALVIANLLLFTQYDAYGSDARVILGDITDKRTTGQFFAECEVELKITGDDVADSLGVRDVIIKEATDDTGRNLIKEENQFSTFFNPNTDSSSTIDDKISLKNPARKAEVIKTLSGEVELFQPSVKTGSKLIVEGFMTNPSEPIGAKTLKDNDIQVMYLTKESYEAKKKEFDEANKADLDKATEQFGAAFAELFSGMFGALMSEEENSLQFFVKDPNEKIVDLGFQDKEGNRIKAWSRSRMGDFHTYSFENSTPPPDTELIIYIATPDSIKKVPFNFEDIPLP